MYNADMRKMFQYRIYPTKKQETRLNETLEECRWLYNHLLAQRTITYEQTGKGLTPVLFGVRAIINRHRKIADGQFKSI